MRRVTLCAWDSESSAAEMLDLLPVSSGGDELRVGAGVPPFSPSARTESRRFVRGATREMTGTRTNRTGMIGVTLDDEACDHPRAPPAFLAVVDLVFVAPEC